MGWGATIGIWIVVFCLGGIVGWGMCARHTDDRKARLERERQEREHEARPRNWQFPPGEAPRRPPMRYPDILKGR